MPEPLDRDAVSRILARAQQLEGDGRSGLDDGRIEPEALVAAASEVGIDPNAVRDSIAIERFTVSPAERRRLDRLVGPATVVVEREVPLVVADALDDIEAWLTSVHKMTSVNRTESSLRAHRRSDASARIGRTVAGLRSEGRLATVGTVAVEAVPQVVGSTPVRPRTVVRIRADRHDARTVRLAGGGTVGLAGAGAGMATAATGLLLVGPFVALPLVVGGYVVARTGRGHADRLELELERLVTRVARGERPTGLLGRTVRRAGASR